MFDEMPAANRPVLVKKLELLSKELKKALKKCRVATTQSLIKQCKTHAAKLAPRAAQKVAIDGEELVLEKTEGLAVDKNLSLLQKCKSLSIDTLTLDAIAWRLKLHFGDGYQKIVKVFTPLKNSRVDLNPLELKMLSSKPLQALFTKHLPQIDRTFTGRRIVKPKIKRAKVTGVVEDADAINEDEDIEMRQDSDAWTSDEEDEIADHDNELKKKVRKNRRGQRARQAIWEMKYKESAKHLTPEALKKKADAESLKKKTELAIKKPNEDLHPSWQAKKSNQVGIVESKGSKIVFGQETSVPVSTSAKPSGESLHPSWEAKKQQKEQAALKLQNAPKAKKMVFDD